MKKCSLPGLATDWLGHSYAHFEVIDSTNNYLRDNAASLPHGQACTAERQTAGKGRAGRSWSDKTGQGLALSFLLRDRKPEELPLLPLLAGIGTARAVEKLCGVSAGIKWPNDVLLEGKKLSGILCESRLAGDNSFVVTGIGVNLNYSGEELESLGLPYATSLLHETGISVDPFDMAARILNEMEPLLDRVGEATYWWREEFVHRCATLGKEIRLISPDGSERTGTALDISDSGELICSINDRVTTIRAGEVSVRGLYGYV